MLASTILRRTKPLRLGLPQSTHLLQQNRAQSTCSDEPHYWQRIAPWKDVPKEEFISYRWQLRNTVSDKSKLYRFLSQTLPDFLGSTQNAYLKDIKTKQDFIEDAVAAIKLAPMAIRLTPHILSRIDWRNPLDDPIRRQFLPLRSGILPDHEKLTLDSLHEEEDSPVPGLVHRYPGRALFLATSICPVYCRFCTRSYAVGGDTDTVSKKPQKPSRKRWEEVFKYIDGKPELRDIVVSGGDAYYLQPDQLRAIGERLLGIPHIRRIRFASKGLSVAPGRILDESDSWTDTLIDLSKQGRDQGKHVCLHTHINHANEITWVTRKAANKLFKHGVIMRNQSVLLKGVNNNFEALKELIESLADINIQPYYVYQCDMVQGVEDLRTPLQEIISLDKKLRGTLTGFMMPNFVIDLPGGGGKRLVSTLENFDPTTGVAEYTAPGLPGEKGQRTYHYSDPQPVSEEALQKFRQHQRQALREEKTLQEVIQASAEPPPQKPFRSKAEPEPASQKTVERAQSIVYGIFPSTTEITRPRDSAYLDKGSQIPPIPLDLYGTSHSEGACASG